MWLGLQASSSLLLFSLDCLCPGMWQAGKVHGKDLSQSRQQIPAGAWGQLSHVGLEVTKEGCGSARPLGTAVFSDLRQVDIQSHGQT